MNSRLRWVLLLAALLLVSLGVAWALKSRRAQPPAPAAAAPPVAMQLAATDVARAARAELSTQLQVSGGLRAVRSAMVRAKVAAEVKEVLVREGDAVRAGQVIVALDDTEFQWRLRQAEDQAAAAKAQLEIAERQLANNKALVDQGFISKTALDTSQMSAQGAAASLQAARAAAEIARKSVGDAVLRAPLAGLVSQRLVQPGERVGVDARLVEIVDISALELEAAIAPEDVPGVRVGQAARLQVDGLAEPVAARVARINPSTQAGTRAVPVYLAVAPSPGLRQGLFARGSIELQRRAALVVPASAVRFDQAEPYVLVVQAGRAEQRRVVLGARGEVTLAGRTTEAIELASGLDEGQTVLLGAVGHLRPGTRIELAGAASAPR
jgi:RND family efflux transporter MFP subunit